MLIKPHARTCAVHHNRLNHDSMKNLSRIQLCTVEMYSGNVGETYGSGQFYLYGYWLSSWV